MFGFVVANSEILSEEEKQRYKAAYCGLCRSLKKRHGQIGRLALNYDMTFLVMVLGSLYEPEECHGCERCFVHPAKRHEYVSSEITDYAADMNVALVYLNQMDNWHDDKSLISLLHAKLLKKKFQRVAQEYPRQCVAMSECIEKLSELEKTGEPNPDVGAQLFGRLMGEIFVFRQDRWEGLLRKMACELGEFIYIMDAVVDLDRDIRKHRYNPLVALKNDGKDDAFFHELLTILLGECIFEFEKLPLVADVSIMKNILCSGVWTRYELEQAKKARRKGEARQ